MKMILHLRKHVIKLTVTYAQTHLMNHGAHAFYVTRDPDTTIDPQLAYLCADTFNSTLNR